MKLDPKKLTVDESRSNPMGVSFVYPDCPINKVCFIMRAGFGNILKQCEYLKTNGDDAECLYKEE